MKGLQLAEKFFNEYRNVFLHSAEELSVGLSERLSIGLAGEGSQCFGFDDAISRDHDFSPGFCVWMNEADYVLYGKRLQEIYQALPKEFDGIDQSNTIAKDRLGVMSANQFYGRYTGIPETELDWLFLSESSLATATNGKIWMNGCEEFHAVRERLLAFYPQDVLRKKVAARAAVLSQAGQYNLLRLIQRQDFVGAQLCLSKFTEAAISMVHLLSGVYTPFYKWAFHSLTQLENPLAKEVCIHLEKLPDLQILLSEKRWGDAKAMAFQITEDICITIGKELKQQGYSKTDSRFLQDHLEEIMEPIVHPEIGAMHPMADPAF